MKAYTIDSIESMQQFFRDVINVHSCTLMPDDSFEDMVDKDDKPTFTQSEAAVLDSAMLQCFEFCDDNDLDIYAIAGDIQVSEYKRLGLLPANFGADTEGD